MATSRVAPGVGSTKKEFHLQKYINILSNGVLLCSTLTICCDVTVFSKSFLDLMAIALVFVWTGEYCLEKRMATRRVAVADLTLINFPAQNFVKCLKGSTKKEFQLEKLARFWSLLLYCIMRCTLFFDVSGGGHPRSFVYLKPITAFGILLTGFCINRKYQWPRLKATQTSAVPPQRLTTLEPNKPQNGERQNAPSKSDYLRTQEGTTLEHTLLGESGRPPSQYWQQLRTDSWETHAEYMDVDTEEYYSRPAHEISTFHEKLYFLDSGAGTHSSDPSNPRSYYHAYPNYKPPIKSISGFTGAAIPVEGCGYIDKGGIRGLHCVLSVPRSIANVVSIGQLTRQYRVKVTFYPEDVWIERIHNGARIGQGHRLHETNQYVLRSFEQPSDLTLITHGWPCSSPAHEITLHNAVVFYLDSGADYHSTKDLSGFTAYQNTRPPIESIPGITGSKLQVKAWGSIDNGVIKLDGVLYIPGSSQNLVSVGQLTKQHNVKVEFYEEKAWIVKRDDGVCIGKGHQPSGTNHYVVDNFYPT